MAMNTEPQQPTVNHMHRFDLTNLGIGVFSDTGSTNTNRRSSRASSTQSNRSTEYSTIQRMMEGLLNMVNLNPSRNEILEKKIQRQREREAKTSIRRRELELEILQTDPTKALSQPYYMPGLPFNPQPPHLAYPMHQPLLYPPPPPQLPAYSQSLLYPHQQTNYGSPFGLPYLPPNPYLRF